MRKYVNPFAYLRDEAEEETEEEEIPAGAAPEAAVPGRRIIMEGARRHMVIGGWNGEYISGCHNSQNFEQMVRVHNLTIEEVKSEGILTEYEIYGDEDETDYLGTKTVYDSEICTDEKMFGLAEQAMNAPNAHVDEGVIEGMAEGIAFRGYLNEDGNVTVVYPIISRHVHF